MASRMPSECYQLTNEFDAPCTTVAAPSGLPSFGPPAGILPQYSHEGRMKPEFSYPPAEGYADDNDDRPAIALGVTTKILGYEPREGTGHTPIVVRLLFRRGYIHPKTRVCLRVKMGNIPIYTDIEGVKQVNGVGGEWRLHLNAPDPRELDVVGLEVPLIVQTLDVESSTIIDDVCIGAFKFWDLTPAEESQTGYFRPGSHSHGINMHPSRPSYSRNISRDEDGSSSQGEERSISTSRPRESTTSALGLINATDATSTGSVHKRARLTIEVPSHNATEAPNDERDTESPTTAKSFIGQKPGEDTYQVSLGFLGDLKSMAEDWTPEEINNQRRIVEFFCVRTRGRIDVSFASIPVETARDTNKNIVSCIWWKDMEEFVITSVDTINLLERLVGTKFTTEEKNRIRRNLQGFKPATVSKNQPESEPFFRTLMEFPPPRPRNIEKDVKAFTWSKLPFMLEKVISKYWFVSSPSSSEADESSPRIRILREMDGASAESPGTSFQSLSASQTHVSAPPSQVEVDPMYTGILESSSYMSAPSSSQVQHEEYHPPAHEHQLDYPRSSQSSSDSTYAHPNPLMEISEVSMEELQSVPMDSSQPLSEYEDMEAYPEAMGALNTGSTYMHQAGEEMQYMPHISHEYA